MRNTALLCSTRVWGLTPQHSAKCIFKESDCRSWLTPWPRCLTQLPRDIPSYWNHRCFSHRGSCLTELPTLYNIVTVTQWPNETRGEIRMGKFWGLLQFFSTQSPSFSENNTPFFWEGVVGVVRGLAIHIYHSQLFQFVHSAVMVQSSANPYTISCQFFPVSGVWLTNSHDL